MRTVKLFAVMIFALLFTLTPSATLAQGKGSKGISFTATSRINIGGRLDFTLTNNSDKPIVLPSTAPWWIVRDDLVVYEPIPGALLIYLYPGQSYSWSWFAKDSNGNDFPSGKYEIWVTYSNEEGSVQYAVWQQFNIRP